MALCERLKMSNIFFCVELLSNGKHPKGFIAVCRDLSEPEADDSKISRLAHTRLQALMKKLEETLPETHVIRLE